LNELTPKSSTSSGIIAWFAANSVAANLMMLVVLILGIYTMLGLRVEGFPSLDPTTISIDVTYNSGSPRQAEEGIAIKIEEALQGVAGIKELRSISSGSGANVTVERSSNYDLEKLNDEVKNKVDAIFGFPQGAETPVITKQNWEEHALWINLYGTVERKQLHYYARKLEQELLRLTSINKVIKTGWQTAEISIEVDETVLQAHGLTLSQLANRVANESLTETSGELRSAENRILLKADGLKYQADEFAAIPVVLGQDGSEVLLANIAQITDGFTETPEVLSRFQGVPSVNLQVIVDKQADVLAIAEQARQLVGNWQQNLPQGLQVTAWWDQSQFMSARLALLAKNGLVGVVLVMLVLAVFLNVRVAFWVGMGLPVCFAGAMILMGQSFFNLTLNDLTTFGFIIVLGILVDDAVIVGESVYSARQQEGDSLAATVKGVKRIAVPTMFGVLTTIAAFYPMSFISGELGKIFSQFALVAVACLLFSMLESKLILPAHLNHVSCGRKTERKNWFTGVQQRADDSMQWLRTGVYLPLMHKVLKAPVMALSLFLSVLVLVVGMIPSGQVGFVFFPEIPRDIVEVNYKVRQGAGYAPGHKLAVRIEEIAAAINQDYSTAKGKPVITYVQSQVLDDENGHIVLEMVPAAERELTANDIANTLRQELGLPEGILQLKIVTDFTGIDQFNLKLLADNYQALEAANQSVNQVLRSMTSVYDIQSDLALGQPQIEFELTMAGRAMGIDRAELAHQISQAFYGAEVQRLQRGKDEVKVFVRYPKDKRQDLTDLQQARIRTASGEVVPLSVVADVSQVYTRKNINRINGRLAATITANIDKGSTSPAEVMAKLELGVLAELTTLYPELQILRGGESEQQDETVSSMLSVFALSLMLIYVLVAVPLKSYWQPFIIMCAIPFGVVGAILGHWVSGLAISILSLNGILALSGVVVNDSLLLVSRFNEIRRQGKSVVEAVLEAASQRLRAILLTSMTTYAGLASLLYESSEQAQYLIPAAASLGYGILFATLISLILIPVLLVLQDRLATKIADLKANNFTLSIGLDK